MFLPIKSYQQNCSVFLFQPTFLGIHIPMGSQGIPMLQIEFLNCCCDSSCLLLFVDVCWLCLLVMFPHLLLPLLSGFFELWCPLTSSNESESCSWCCWCLQLGLRQVDPSGLMGTSGSQRIHGAPLWSWGVLDLHLLCVRNSVPAGWFSRKILDETSQDKVMKGIKQGAFWQKRVIFCLIQVLIPFCGF